MLTTVYTMPPIGCTVILINQCAIVNTLTCLLQDVHPLGHKPSSCNGHGNWLFVPEIVVESGNEIQWRYSSLDHARTLNFPFHDVWRASGYRFTVKDNPRTKDGHKTRLWCTQDDARQNRKRHPEKSRTLVTGEVVAKIRYPCHSRLLILSCDTTQPNHRIVTVRIEPNLATLYSASASSTIIFATSMMGWSTSCNSMTIGCYASWRRKVDHFYALYMNA
ncbi:hypothetical protein EDD85DRAFT_245925 [Armillaria nabsnona]|nr:hypothetical protein EDD85DRAFT_245925 [Armillaria nabsnona]